MNSMIRSILSAFRRGAGGRGRRQRREGGETPERAEEITRGAEGAVDRNLFWWDVEEGFFGEAANADGAIDALFAQIDRNGNGAIEEGELTAYLDEL